MTFILALAALAAAQTCPSPATAVSATPPVALAALAAPASASAAAIDANARLADMQSSITALMAKNDRGALAVTPAESARVKAVLAAIGRDIATLQAKYRAATGPVTRAALDAEVDALLDQNHAADKALILSLRSRGITAQGHECENFCWESCYEDSWKKWVCFLTCRRQCGG